MLVSYPVVKPNLTVYKMMITNTISGWKWEGTITADGIVNEARPLKQITQEESRQIAEDFIKNSPTFRFDGIGDTFKFVNTVTLRTPFAWQFTFEFQSSHAGYGDRTEQMVTQVITPHTTVITVIMGRIIEATIDNKWDELEQTFLETSPSPVPAAPNDSIVTARVIAINKQSDGSTWEITMEIQDSEDVISYLNATKDKIGQQMKILTIENVSSLKTGQSIKANVRLQGDEFNRFYYASNIRWENRKVVLDDLKLHTLQK